MVTISTLSQSSSSIEICSHLSEEGSKKPLFEPKKLGIHTNEGKRKEKKGGEEKTAMVAYLISFYNGYFKIAFGREKLFVGNVFKNPVRYAWPKKSAALLFNMANLESSDYKVTTLQTQGWYNGYKVY